MNLPQDTVKEYLLSALNILQFLGIRVENRFRLRETGLASVMLGSVAPRNHHIQGFANNFWGKDDAGVAPMLERVHNAKTTCDELKAFYSTRAAIEDEYARKLLILCRKALGSSESGTLRTSLDTVRGETETIGKTHAAIASQMKSELEEPLAAFAGGMKERRKIVQNGIERLLKIKMQQMQAVNKSRDRYEQDCLRIKGYLAQGHMVMGQEERKNKAKLEKTQIQLASNSSEYEAAIKVLEETTGRWNKEWKVACDKFQDLEEERLDFTKSSLWNYANIASTACVSDDASCERIRVSLESCEVEKDISTFIMERGTGQEIPDPPKYINFCRGDLNDTVSETSEEESYSVAQFQRTINPAYRSASPAPSTYESHHDSQANLMTTPVTHTDPSTSASRETTVTPQRSHQPQQQSQQQKQPPQQLQEQQPPPLDLRRGGHVPPNYQPTQHGDIPNVPHNEYPTDGMTMFCRTGPPSERSSGTTANRPSSRDSYSDISNLTSFSSVEAPGAKQSPKKVVNGTALPGMIGGKQVQKKRSGFFSNSPFRRKSKHDKERQTAPSITAPVNRNTWSAPPQKQISPVKPAYQKPIYSVSRHSGTPEPVDPCANFQLNIGNNVFDVASPDGVPSGATSTKKEDDLDPIAQALADLKGVGKQSSVRVSADRYHGISTPVPPSVTSSHITDVNISAAQSGTPPPAYNDSSVKRLGAPQPAFTSAQMQKTTRKYVGQTQEMFNSHSSRTSQAENTVNQAIPRAVSPAPQRSLSPQPPPSRGGEQRQQYEGQKDPSPASYHSHSASMNSRYRQSPTVTPTKVIASHPYSPRQYSSHGSPNDIHSQRSVSPQPQFRRQERPSSASGMELQLSHSHIDPYGGGHTPDYRNHGSRGGNPRPMSMYYGSAPDVTQGSRARSRSVATADGNRQLSVDVRPVLHYGKSNISSQFSCIYSFPH
ncbi:SH3 domain-containing protein [Histoplasma capsulatum]|uniref:SH3 domain-containing protein n=1 Tax=Ajellomyces capsulatus TaxID=5037 RepID=A0A8A1ML00_AJECA|nr:SH3 domain-containing protein [Histoplasma capsulatum]